MNKRNFATDRSSLWEEYHAQKENKAQAIDRKNKVGKIRWQTILAVSMCLVFVIIAIIAPVLAVPDDPQDPTNFRQISSGISRKPQVPSQDAILGTVDRSYDIYYSLIWGTRQSVIFGLSTALVAAFIGTIVGTSSAYVGGRLDNIVMRITDAFLSFPIISAVALFTQLQSLLSPVLSSGLATGGGGVTKFNIVQKLIINTNPIFLALIIFHGCRMPALFTRRY